MGKTVSVYIDDDLLERMKESDQSVSRIVREALQEWFNKQIKDEDYQFVENALFGKLSHEGATAWKELLEERDRW
jgi:post-segregation antitoxin (ccd killing protein)